MPGASHGLFITLLLEPEKASRVLYECMYICVNAAEDLPYYMYIDVCDEVFGCSKVNNNKYITIISRVYVTSMQP